MTTSKKNFEKEYPRVHSMLEELKKENEELNKQNEELQKENEILLVRPNWITLKKLQKENEELKKENKRIFNASENHKWCLVEDRKFILKLQKENEELKAMVNDLIPAKIVRNYQLFNEGGDIKEKNKLIEKWNK